MSVSVNRGNVRTGAELVPTSVKIEIDGGLANDLSALLLTLPDDQFARFRTLSDGLDRHIAGRKFGGELR